MFERGDLVWIDFDPTAGHEQSGRRPALVVSPKAYNKASGLFLACAMTTKKKGYPFEVCFDGSVVLADQVRILDGKARNAKKFGAAPPAAVAEVLGKLAALLT